MTLAEFDSTRDHHDILLRVLCETKSRSAREPAGKKKGKRCAPKKPRRPRSVLVVRMDAAGLY